MSQQERIEFLLGKLRQRICTPAELEEVKQWLYEQNQPELIHYLDADLEQQSGELSISKSDQIWQGLRQQLPPTRASKQTAKIRFLHLGWVAAAVLVGVMAFTGYYLLEPFSEGTENRFAERSITSTQEKISLPDGSSVWLNQNSQLSYPEAFSDSVRLITLEGEAYFEVEKDPERPFIVQAGPVATKVLGTSFNIRAYQADTLITVALIEGRVRVETPGVLASSSRETLLLPNEKMLFSKRSNQQTKQTFTGNLPYAWKEAVVYFDGASVQEVISVLEDKYQIQIVVPAGLMVESKLVHRLNTKKQSVQQALDVISRVTNYHFEKVVEGKYELKLD